MTGDLTTTGHQPPTLDTGIAQHGEPAPLTIHHTDGLGTTPAMTGHHTADTTIHTADTTPAPTTGHTEPPEAMSAHSVTPPPPISEREVNTVNWSPI